MKHYYLHTNTEFSFLNSTIKLEKLFKLASEKEYEYLAMTDINNMFALGMFLNLSKKYNIKPIIGFELLQDNISVIIIAKNYEGYIELNNIAFLVSKGQKVELESLDSNNVYVIDHEENGYLKNNLEVPKISNFWYNSKTIISDQTIYAPVKKVLFEDDNEALIALQTTGNNKITNSYYNDYFNEKDFIGIDNKVLLNVNTLVNSINIIFPDSTPKLAEFKNDLTPEKLLYKQCLIGLDINKKEFEKYSIETVMERLTYEYKTIVKLGFCSYFLIIKDVIDFAKNKGIYIGPGRGSAAGSLISFLLGITKINPLKYNLLFERFLNVDRVTMPDIDIDIQDDRRDEIAKYIVEKYGYEYCSYISTFQSIGAKMAIRDIGRYLQINLNIIDSISKSLDQNETLEEACLKNRVFKAEISEYPKLLELAKKIEGIPRQHGIHPAGIIISNTKITDIAPTYSNSTNLSQIQLPLNFLEDYGLLKIDFLGLKTLSIIKDIEEVIPNELRFDYLYDKNENIFNDKKTFDVLNSGLTEGIFQLESPGMKSAITKVSIDSFNDLVAIISLFRPGPMQYIDQYANGKKDPKTIKRIHPYYDEIVKDTFGIIVYQEQIMQIVQKISSMTFSQADLLRRAISKKDEKKLVEMKSSFFEGGIKNNIKKDVLDEIYARIELFADYGFNKSHAVAYSYITYKMAYYKTNYKNVFYRALISNANGTHLTINKYVKEAKSVDISVQSPDINFSKKHAVVINSNLYLPLNMIKGVGGVALEKIINTPKDNKKFSSFFELYLKLRNSGVGESIINALIKSNTFRTYGNVNSLLNSLSIAKNLYETFKLKVSRLKIQDEKIDDELVLFIKENNLLDRKVDIIDRDIETESKYELELLGNTYNTFITSDLEGEIKIKNFPIETETWIVVYVNRLVHVAKKNIWTVVLSDSSDEIAIFISENDYDNRFKNLKKNTIIKAKLYRSMKNKYYLRDWKER
ncbi:DNA polymerase III subunit alpha [Mycoplasma crocodyli]|uniref:DNA-directed DNA polymerase n=1 Tax=Mycoplasma crocodyli (strain ATCC 51981 / MP145) TaxID=512564 RepID=D5E5Y0_MYCCM|nr:DNA polymerase III subunit alpha [Mycoplasma crocodyli]ADE19659.1 DNA polymerase III, alpha subunit [Mycoplasma crocodyli MP145]